MELDTAAAQLATEHIAQEMISTPSKELVIDFFPYGGVEAMQSDKFSLSFLGRQQVRRATEIIFNENRQCWDIELILYNDKDERVGQVVYAEGRGFAGYDEARGVEVKWLNLCRVYRIEPHSVKGASMLIQARNAMEEVVDG